jgi:hypothetical protein
MYLLNITQESSKAREGTPDVPQRTAPAGQFAFLSSMIARTTKITVY